LAGVNGKGGKVLLGFRHRVLLLSGGSIISLVMEVRQQIKTARILIGPGPPDFKIGCA
jgi:hypothetical protein